MSDEIRKVKRNYEEQIAKDIKMNKKTFKVY